MLKTRIKEPDTNLVKIFNLQENEELISLDLDGKNIGYGIIRDNTDNPIEIFILKQYQNNGYGSYLFCELLKKLNKPLNIIIPIDNFKMIKIIVKNNGIELGRNGKNIMFFIPNINNEIKK